MSFGLTLKEKFSPHHLTSLTGPALNFTAQSGHVFFNFSIITRTKIAFEPGLLSWFGECQGGGMSESMVVASNIHDRIVREFPIA